MLWDWLQSSLPRSVWGISSDQKEPVPLVGWSSLVTDPSYFQCWGRCSGHHPYDPGNFRVSGSPGSSGCCGIECRDSAQGLLRALAQPLLTILRSEHILFLIVTLLHLSSEATKTISKNFLPKIVKSGIL